MSRKTRWTIGAMISLALWALIILMFAGCTQDNGLVVDPNAVEAGAEAAITLTGVLGLIWPALIPVGTAAGGIYGAYKRLKPQLQEAQKASDKYLAAGETLTAVLEDIKLHQPELWAKIGPLISTALTSAQATALENTIREFRGLAPKPELNQGV